MAARTSSAGARAADVTDIIDHRTSGDFYRTADVLTPDEREVLGRVRRFSEEKVAPVINDYWSRAEFPMELIPHYAALGVAGGGYRGYGCLGKSTLFDGFVMKELARIDCSMATFHAVHSGLAMGTIYLCGSEEQKRDWLPRMQRCDRRVRAHGAGCRLRRCPRPHDHGSPRRRRVGAQWAQAMDRQRHLRRCHGDLGTR